MTHYPDPDDRPPGGPPAEIKIQFIKEVLFFTAGVLLGFFWYLYSDTSDALPEVHIIIALLVVIMMLGRYIMLTRRL